MQYKGVKFIFPQSLSKSQEDTLIAGVQFIRDQAITSMRRSESNLLGKLAEKLTPKDYASMSEAVKVSIKLLIQRLENDRKNPGEPNPLLYLEKDGDAYIFAIDHAAFSALSFKTKLAILDINLDYADKVIRKLKTSFREEIAAKMGIKASEVLVSDFEK